MGANSSHLEKEIGTEQFPANEHYLGLINFGNTCYCNSVLQALYFCKPFREKVLHYRAHSKNKKETLLTCLCDLFWSISTSKKKTGSVAPKKFISKLRKENELFDNFMQQDAHEFLNYLLNSLADILEAEDGQHQPNSASGNLRGSKLSSASSVSTGTLVTSSLSTGTGAGGHSTPGSSIANTTTSDLRVLSPASPSSTTGSLHMNGSDGVSEAGVGGTAPPGGESRGAGVGGTWVHDLFQGTHTSEIRCLNCESVSSRSENFLDISVDVQQNTSITHCLREFSQTNTLCAEQKYYCENCCSMQEAHFWMKIKKLPKILALHLKRFKYIEQLKRYTKLPDRVVFPFELRLFNTSSEAVNADRLYDLVAVVVHCGSGPNRGHYISIVRSHGLWLLFDDDLVDKIDPSAIEDFYGLSTTENGYALGCLGLGQAAGLGAYDMNSMSAGMSHMGGGAPLGSMGGGVTGGQKSSTESGYILFYQSRDLYGPPV